MRIYEPYNNVPENVEEGYRMFNQAISLYRDRKFEEALGLLHKCKVILKNDTPCNLYIERCSQLMKNPPGKEWDGVFTLTTK